MIIAVKRFISLAWLGGFIYYQQEELLVIQQVYDDVEMKEYLIIANLRRQEADAERTGCIHSVFAIIRYSFIVS